MGHSRITRVLQQAPKKTTVCLGPGRGGDGSKPDHDLLGRQGENGASDADPPETTRFKLAISPKI